MKKRNPHHRWMDPEPTTPGRVRSLCSECGMVIEHQARRRPGVIAAGRVVDGKPITSMQSIPTCGGAPRKRYPGRHQWTRVGDAEPSPRGAACSVYRCERCQMELETLNCIHPGATKSRYNWSRYRQPGEEWTVGKAPRCLDVMQDEVTVAIGESLADLPMRGIAKQLGKSIAVVRKRAGILRENGAEKCREYCRWSEEDDAKLIREWNPRDIKQTASAMRRSTFSVLWRARKIGLIDSRGCPRGYEFVTDSEARLGFSAAELMKIIKATGLHVIRPLTKYGKRWQDRRLYDSEKLTEAVDWWLSTANVGSAAKDAGIATETLSRWLAWKGIVRPEEHTAYSWRLPIELLDEVIEKNLRMKYKRKGRR